MAQRQRRVSGHADDATMTTQLIAGALLILLPIAYNVLFAELSRTFDYPDILRRPTAEVLSRFAAGGSRLVLTWWGFAMSALLLVPAVVLLSHAVADANATVVSLAATVGILAALVQLLGLVRWPFAVPHLARLAADPEATPATLAAVDVTFETLNRLLGVAIGEHLGYLLTGLWTGLTGVALIQSDVLHPAFGIIALVLAPLFMVGSAEFLGRFEPRGWKPAGVAVPIVYIAWSLWLLGTGIGLIATSGSGS
jgi:hypothetical protein